MGLQFSAGGIVYKKRKAEISILVSQHSQHHGWVFPKGLIGDKIKGEKKSASARLWRDFGLRLDEVSLRPDKVGETKEKAAVREVKEETGINGKIVKQLPPVTYWYQLEGEKIKKTVYYFLMERVSGDIKNHDREMEKVEWLPIEEVEKRLTYESDKEAWIKAKGLIVNGL